MSLAAGPLAIVNQRQCRPEESEIPTAVYAFMEYFHLSTGPRFP
jgi:hypothetical protein